MKLLVIRNVIARSRSRHPSRQDADVLPQEGHGEQGVSERIRTQAMDYLETLPPIGDQWDAFGYEDNDYRIGHSVFGSSLDMFSLDESTVQAEGDLQYRAAWTMGSHDLNLALPAARGLLQQQTGEP